MPGQHGLPTFNTIRRYWSSTQALHQAVRLQQRLQEALVNTEHKDNHGNHLEISD